MRICSRTVTGPASWASALINGDQSGLTTEDVIALNRWRARELQPGENIVSTHPADAEPYFSKAYWLYDDRFNAGDLLDYVVLSS